MEIRGLGEGTLQYGKELRRTSDFFEELKRIVLWVNQQRQEANNVREAFLKGEDVPLHRLVIEMEKASLALSLLVQIRNKLVEAFQELNRMQV
ncbi:flagellar hook-basal body complex subunit FliE [Thermocrinis albus DSM 14484]|uniref:Flagellar hook-basal body complex protein FliE n=1 Tax=Thermocrinis albus (strain DSM 14484 / JCM 11386 / HI 11/12) TaxID=638303 RepID=D3SQ49_THEAH|nr:flagellar hook-basal body complex protein FliE [Thermocrinis albus]ADC89286.1 flagellar hook-basal body complex subunit FliE [Thermocrinis albus DSM 14484]